jgi:hypothetical protein
MPQPAIPSPRTWSPSDLVFVPRLRADVSDAVAFLAGRPNFVGQNTTGASWSAGADNNLGLNAELLDSWNGHSTASNSSRYYAPVPGWYLCRSMVAFATFATPAQTVTAGGFNAVVGGSVQATVRGGVCLVNAGASLAAQCCDLIEQTASGPVLGGGDYIQPTALQNTGAAVLLDTGVLAPAVSIRWVCATSGTEPLAVPPLTAVPSPITAAWLNANVRDAIRFLIYPPIAKAFYTAGSSTLASTTFPAGAVVPLTTVAVDSYGGISTGAAAGYTAPVAGRYFVYGQVNLASATVTTAYHAGLAVNGGTVTWGDGNGNLNGTLAAAGGATVGRYLRLNAGDKVQLMGCQGTGAAVAYNTSVANQTRLIAVWAGS